MKKSVKNKIYKISLSSLVVFNEVVKRKSLSRAAKSLSISQPAVTKHIKNLEQKLGVSLIDRKERGFALNDMGKILFKTTKRISSHLLVFEKLLDDLREEHVGRLIIGAAEPFSRYFLPDMLTDFEACYPLVNISLNLADSEETERNLFTYKNDLALIGIAEIHPRVVYAPLLSENLVLIAHPSHPLMRNEVISLRETVAYPFVVKNKGSTLRKIILEAFNSLGVYPTTLMEAGSQEFIKQWVMRGNAISVTSKSAVVDEERKGLIQTSRLQEDLHMHIAFVYLKEKETAPVIKLIKRFISYAKNWVGCHEDVTSSTLNSTPFSTALTSSHIDSQDIYVPSESGTIESLKMTDALKALPLISGGSNRILSCF
jgi:DNA-binding transcriptional LysR family regulator